MIVVSKRTHRPLISNTELRTLAVGFVAGVVVMAVIGKPRRASCVLGCCSKILDAIIEGKL